MLRRWVQESDPSAILDAGCGQGICSDKIDLTKRSYTGIDMSPRLIARAIELYSDPNKRFVVGNVCETKFADHAFDALFCVNLIHLIEDLSAAIKEFSRVLRPEGHFLIVTANPDTYHLWEGLYASTHRAGKRLEGVFRHDDGSETQDVLFLHSLGEIQDTLNAQGLSISLLERFRKSRGPTPEDQYLALYGQKRRDR